MNTLSATPFPDDEWQMGGSKDVEANAALGLTEVEVAQIAVEAYGNAWDKERDNKPGKGQQERFAYEVASEIQRSIEERLGLYAD